jgi:nicotinate-nucleotide pyrophosphorylase (carboxylating)
MDQITSPRLTDLKLFINRALDEDAGQLGDVTSLATVAADQKSVAHFLVKEDCLLAGVALVQVIALEVDPNLEPVFLVRDGDLVSKNQKIGTLTGNTRSILLAERLMLNCMQRMTGIATKVNRLKELIKEYPAVILDTRKTTPNFRFAEKWAVQIGGGMNHRFGLYDMILIKDNHIKASGSITKALSTTQDYCIEHKLKLPVLVEVKTKEELLETLAVEWVTRILLDNMSPSTVSEMVKLTQKRKPLEVSGGINERNIQEYAATGVDFISIGDLTHHIESVDISLKIE